MQIIITDKSIDEEEYILFRANREKVVGEKFCEGSMEVAFELWIEQMILSRLQRRFPPLSREAISDLQEDFCPVDPPKHRKVAIFRRKMSGFEVF